MTKTHYLNNATAICALGNNIDTIEKALFADGATSPLQNSDDYSPQPRPLGRVNTTPSSTDDIANNSRNNDLLRAALTPLLEPLEKLKQRYGSSRIGVIVGSSTSGISEGEAAERHFKEHGSYPENYHYLQQEVGAPSRAAAKYLGIDGPAWTISTACTSGAKALASAKRLLQSGLVDAVVAGGCDTLCSLTVQGFASLGAVSDEICQPFSQNRNGINIGEGAAFFLVSHEPGPVVLAGVGESSDAHHISAPHPNGDGAEHAIQQALANAQLTPDDIDYVNLHGTATAQNDAMEAKALSRVFSVSDEICKVPCSSTKPFTGHTLGAAGALEAAFCYLTICRSDGRLPPHLWDAQQDQDMPALQGLGVASLNTPAQYAMSNSFAFGGNNISLVFRRAEQQP